MKHNYGLTHGLIVAAVMAASHFLWLHIGIGNFAIPAGLIVSGYYFLRERSARTKDGTPRFKDWYFDSQMDAVVPFLVVLAYWGLPYVTNVQIN